ncbi:MAG: ABC transporter ATP-binding protein [Fimbriimonadaceae bacterium]|nr:ABC transporter ATP-binding protein [Fimbriimonadaceae bacterium]
MARVDRIATWVPREQRGSLRNLWRFLAFSRPYRALMLGGFVTGLVRMILPMYMPVFVKNCVDHVLLADGLSGPQRLATFYGMLPAFLALVAVHAVVTLGRFYLPQAAASNAVRDIQSRLFSHIQRLSLGFHHERPSGTVVTRVTTDVSTAQEAFESIIVVASQMLMESIGIAGYLLYRDWVWALAAFATVPIFVLASQAVRDPMRRASRQILESTAALSGHIVERVAMIREVQAFCAEPYEEVIVGRRVGELRRHALRRNLLQGLLTAVSELTRILATVFVIGFGIYRVTSGHATVGDVTAFYIYVGMLMGPITSLTNIYGRIYSAAAAADRVFEFLDTEPTIQDRPNARALHLDGPPEIRFEGLTFGYPGRDEPALADLSFTAPSGARIVLAGPSGSGKTTLVSLLPRFWDPDAGRILLNGTDLRDWQHRSLRQTIAIVPQEPTLFSGSIRDNILYGRLEASQDEIEAAARAANAEEFISQLPDGYDTLVGERGVGLSGGQIQRVAIARAFLRDPQVLILDEATSNLDATSERLVLEALDRLAEGRTTFIIAHRLSVARTADLILVLQDGRVVEEGGHEALLRQRGLYATLWRQQMGSLPAAAGD